MIKGNESRLFGNCVLHIFLIIVLSGVSFGSYQAAWVRVDSQEGRYSVSMPGKPTELATPFAIGVFRGVSHVAHVSSGGYSYSASYADLPIDYSDETIPAKVFEAAKSDLLEKAHARVLAEKNLTLSGNPGQEIRAQGYHGIIISRSFLVKNRLYQAVVLVPDNSPEENATRFLESFLLVDAPASD
jgi:hypothetical protein